MNEKFWFFKGLLRKWSSLDKCIKFTRKMPSNRLVQLLDPKICVLQKVGPKIVFGNYKTQLWVKSYVLNMCSERTFVLWISSSPFPKVLGRFGVSVGSECANTKFPFKCSCLQRSHSAFIPLWVISLLCTSFFIPLISVLLQASSCA